MILTIDASVFVAAARPQESHYSVSRQFLRQARLQDAMVFCPTLVLPECVAAIVRPTGDIALAEELVALIAGYPGLRLVNLDPPLAHQAAQVAIHHRLRGADSVYVAVASAANATLITWDDEILTRGAGIVTTRTPLQWMAEREAAE
ncbi:MAG: PIN domain-containing protein [Anaerolineae bacterium]|nr:PIN domain-containing protein [Anaerolineae bacterium]